MHYIKLINFKLYNVYKISQLAALGVKMHVLSVIALQFLCGSG